MGLSFGKVAKEVGCKDYTVSRLSRKIEAGESLDNKASPGRPPKITEGQTQFHPNVSEQSKAASYCNRKGYKETIRYSSQPSTDWSDRKWCRAPRSKAAKKPLLTWTHIERRLKWAQEHQAWTAKDWENMIWSNESSPILICPFWKLRDVFEIWPQTVNS